MTIYMSIVHIPWTIKILYGLISDNVPIQGTRRKSYIVLMGLVQFFSLILIFSLNSRASPLGVALLLTFAAMSEAFVNVVADAIMCI
jgi:MFS-type transporter involved in bile tolerance (Atg22 family)